MSTRGFTFIAVVALLAGCTGAEPATRAADTSPTPEPAPPSTNAHAGDDEAPDTTAEAVTSVSGTFQIVNTTSGGGEVAIESLEASVEVSTGGGWSGVEAHCDLDPSAPIVIAELQVFAFYCALTVPVAAGTDVRVTTEADVVGLDQPVRQIIDLG